MKVIRKIILKIKQFWFMTKYSWANGRDFVRLHGRMPNEQEQLMGVKLAELAWIRHYEKKGE